MSSSQYDPRITAYFGDAVLRAGFMPVPHLFLRHYRQLGLSHLQALFVLQLMEIAWDLGDPPSTVSKLAERLGVERRTVQICSKEVHRLGLVEIYDQWDEGGAQVENGYDLSPLFHKLAALAPEPKLSGQIRTRRTRYGTEHSDSTIVTSSPPRTADRTGGRSAVHPVPRSADHPGPGSPDQGVKAQQIAAPSSAGSGLKWNIKNPTKNHKKVTNTPTQPASPHEPLPQGGVGGESETHEHSTTFQPGTDTAAGRSFRWNTPLSASEIATSRKLLDYVGLSRSVTHAVAPTLHPAEVWALWTYARAAHLAPAWIAKQVYNRAQKQPQAAELSTRYDAAGRLLAALEPATATQVVELVDSCCPRTPDAVFADPLLVDASAPVLAAVHAVWSMMAEQRGGSLRLAVPSTPKAGPSQIAGAEQDDLSRLWQAVLNRLSEVLPASAYTTWMRSTMLLEIDHDVAVVGTPNCIARDHVAATYASQIADALAVEYGQRPGVEFVIGTLEAA